MEDFTEENHNNSEEESTAKETLREEKIPVTELLYGVIFQPSKTFPLFRYYQPWGWAFGFLFLVNLITTLLAFLGMNSSDIFWTLPPKFAGALEPMRASIGIYVSVFVYPLTIVFFAISVSVLHFLAELMGGKGQVLSLFSALAFVQILGVFSAVLKIFLTFLASSNTFFLLPLGLAFGIWQLILSIIAIREIYLVTTGRAMLVIFLPGIIIIAVVLYMIFTGVALLGPLFGTFRTYL